MTTTLSLAEHQLFALADAEPLAPLLIGPTHSSLLLDDVLYVAARSES